MSGLAWLNELMIWLGKWFPRLVLVKRGYAAVRFGPSGSVEQAAAGLHWYWPITTEFQIVSLLERSSEIATQLHGREVVSLCVFYRIVSPTAMLLSQNDIFSMLDDRAQAALASAYAVEKSNSDLASAVHVALRDQFIDQGVDVRSVSILQRGRVIPLKNLNDWANHAKAEL